MNRHTLVAVGVASALALSVPNVAGAGTTPNPNPKPSQLECVSYYDSDGVLQTVCAVPGGSSFRSAGGSDRAPCMYYDPDYDPDGASEPQLPRGEYRPSKFWRFRETTVRDSPLTQDIAEQVAVFAGLGPEGADAVFARYGSVDDAFRRFNVWCVDPDDASRLTSLDPILVGIRDPFWDPYPRVGLLWNTVRLDRPVVATEPKRSTYGGLVINMPTSFHIGALPWKPYQSEPDDYRGWLSQLVVTPGSLGFELTFDPDDGAPTTFTMSCLDSWTAQPSYGSIPRRDTDIPDFAMPDQFEAPCVWIPPDEGNLTIRAVITYDVRLTVSGYVDDLDPYRWVSEPYTIRVAELRVVNVIGP